jgi:hypothetical protein
MISDEQIEDALAYLAKNVEAAAEARANKWFMVEGRKIKKAQLMNKANESSEAAKERFAYSHADYEAHNEETKLAIKEDARHEFRRGVYSATVDAWRTQQATIRTAERVT